MARRRLPTPLLLLWFGFIFSSSAIAQNNVVGQWSPVTIWRYVATHAHVLPTGKVIWWPQFANGDNPYFGIPRQTRIVLLCKREQTFSAQAMPFYPTDSSS